MLQIAILVQAKIQNDGKKEKKKKTQTLSVVVGGERERRAIEWVESGTIHQGSLLVLYINFITTANYFWFFPMLFILFKGPFY